jgi:hypothetical protein
MKKTKPNDHQKTVQGKNQRGPRTRVGRNAGGGNAGSKGQNVRRQDHMRRGSGAESRDVGDERVSHGGSGGGQKNRMNKQINRSGPQPGGGR